jgi:CheY-like chemotaxis protein
VIGSAGTSFPRKFASPTRRRSSSRIIDSPLRSTYCGPQAGGIDQFGGAVIPSTSHLSEEIIRVLFIEGDPAVAEMYRLKLELDGYHVVVVADDDRVPEEAARTRPDMIYIDLRLGDERRLATLQQLRSTTDTRDLPVIILSNVGASELTAQGYTPDLLDYVVRAASDLNAWRWNVEEWARAGSG